MTTTTKSMALAAALLVPLFAAVVQANNVSDHANGAETVTNAGANPTIRTWDSDQDWCNAVDIDGPGGAPPTGDHNSCDNDSTNTVSTINGPGDPTGLVGLFFPNCVDTPDSTTTWRTDCDNGTFGLRDDNGGDFSDGRFGGNYPNATRVVISVAVGQVAIIVQTGYRDPWAASGGTANPVTFTGISPTVCIGNGVTYTVQVGNGGATDPPAGTTIDGVFVGRVLTVGACGGVPAGNTPKTITMAWTYAAQEDDSTVAAAVTVTPDAGGLTCTITFNNSASVYSANGEGRWGAVGSSIMIGPSNEYGNFQSVGPQYGASGAWAGAVLVKAVHGQVVTYAVWAWSIEGKYKVAFGTLPCNNPPGALNEPACVAIVINGALQLPTPLCLPAGSAVCGPNAPASPEGALAGVDCVSAALPCVAKAVHTYINGAGGAARARVWCDEDADGVRDDAGDPPFVETKNKNDITGVVPDITNLVTGIKTFGAYHCTMVWTPTFTGTLKCFDP